MKTNILYGRIIMSVSANLLLSACSADVKFGSFDNGLIRFESGSAMSEDFKQGVISNKIDLLFIVDNSGSMSDEQKKLGDRIDSFLLNLDDVDWQLGITTTDVSSGPFGIKGSLLNFAGTSSHILTKNTPNYMQVFKDTIVRAESINCELKCPSGNEQPLHAGLMAIEKRHSDNKGFFRQSADLGLLILSDEDEMSSGPAEATRPEEVIKKVAVTWQNEKQLYAYGMVIKPGDRACLDAQTTRGYYGTFVSHLATLTGGLIGSICDEDYAPTLGKIAEHARRLMNYVELKATPMGGEVQVMFSPEHITTWSVERRRVYFAEPPPKGTQIMVNYIVE